VNCPIKKFHGWNPKPNVVFEWYPGWGSTSCSWQLVTFVNKVDDFLREDKKAEEKNCQANKYSFFHCSSPLSLTGEG